MNGAGQQCSRQGFKSSGIIYFGKEDLAGDSHKHSLVHEDTVPAVCQ